MASSCCRCLMSNARSRMARLAAGLPLWSLPRGSVAERGGRRMFINRMPRYEPLSEDALVTLERGWERLGTDVGVRFDHPRALELFRAAGQDVEDDVVRFEPGFLRAQAAQAPEEFVLKARNPR